MRQSLLYLSNNDKSSVIRQKVESQNGCFKKTNHAKFSKKTNISYPLIRTHVRFSENLAGFVFLKHPFWNSPFCLITDEIDQNNFKVLKKDCQIFIKETINIQPPREREGVRNLEICQEFADSVVDCFRDF